STLHGVNGFVTIENAALVNGIATHSLELEDTFEESSLHPTIVLFPQSWPQGLHIPTWRWSMPPGRSPTQQRRLCLLDQIGRGSDAQNGTGCNPTPSLYTYAPLLLTTEPRSLKITWTETSARQNTFQVRRWSLTSTYLRTGEGWLY